MVQKKKEEIRKRHDKQINSIKKDEENGHESSLEKKNGVVTGDRKSPKRRRSRSRSRSRSKSKSRSRSRIRARLSRSTSRTKSKSDLRKSRTKSKDLNGKNSYFLRFYNKGENIIIFFFLNVLASKNPHISILFLCLFQIFNFNFQFFWEHFYGIEIICYSLSK